MKKNIIIIISIVVVLVAVVAMIIAMKGPEEKQVQNKQPVYTDAITDVNNDLQAIDFGSLDKEFEDVNKNIESL